MPALSSVGDSTTLQNLYSGRTIFLVEGPGDKNAYERIIGPGFEADVEFKVVPSGAGQGGCRAIRERVPEERKNNLRVFGLLDGEVAASVGGTTTLLSCKDPLFELNSSPGLIFLGAHELENLYLGYADVPQAIASHASVARLHLQRPADVASSMNRLLDRYVSGSVFKYASSELHSLGLVRGIINTRIFGSGTRGQIKTQVRASVTSGGGTTWSAFLAKVFAIAKEARQLLSTARADERRRWILRIADGKELLFSLRATHGNVGEAVESRLLDDVCASPFAGEFRTALFAAASVKPTTFV